MNAGDDAAGCIPQAPKKIIKELPSRSVKGPSFKIPSPHDLGLHHVLKPLRPLVNPLVGTLAKRRLEKAVNIADLRMCAKKRAHKMVTCVLRAHTRCFAFRAHTKYARSTQNSRQASYGGLWVGQQNGVKLTGLSRATGRCSITSTRERTTRSFCGAPRMRTRIGRCIITAWLGSNHR